MLSLCLTFLLSLEADTASRPLEVFRELAAQYLSETESAERLFEIGSEIATLYFTDSTDADRIQIEAELGAILRAHRDLGPLFIPLGNALHERAIELYKARRTKVRKIQIVTAGASALIGALVLHGAIHLRFIPPVFADHKILTVVAGSIAAAGIGYFVIGRGSAWALLPVDEAAKTADDFLDRYPKGIDFLHAASDPTWTDPLDEVLND